MAAASSRSTSARAAGAPRAARPAFFSVTVSLAGIDGPRGSTRGERYAAMKAQAKAARERVVAWLKEQDVKGEYRRIGDVTAFGTFTIQCTANVMRLLKRAPGVESVVRTGDLPMSILGKR